MLLDYIFILDLTHDFNGRLGKDHCKTRRETFECYDLVATYTRDLTVITQTFCAIVEDDMTQNNYIMLCSNAIV